VSAAGGFIDFTAGGFYFMNAHQDHANLLDQLSAEQGNESSFFWNETKWSILPGGSKFRRKNSLGGFELDCDLQLTLTSTQFAGNQPDSMDQFVYLGKDYTVKMLETMAGGYQLRIHADLTYAEK
jgi:hypothetical protein